MRYPEYLPKGGTIGFVAPSFGCNIEPYKSGFDNAQKKFKDLGYSLQLGPNCYAGEGIGISNSPQKCADELMEAYCDETSDVLISCGGGELMCEILSYMDFERIKAAKPKWYMGYSDNTNFAYLQATICDTAAVYGPCAPAFGMEPWHPVISDALALLTGKKTALTSYGMWEKESLKTDENPCAPYNLTEKSVLHNFPEGDVAMEGRLLGGCLDCLGNICGTKYDAVEAFCEKYKEDGILWFMEACDLHVFDIRRALWRLKNAGWFKYVKGFIFGRPVHFGQDVMGLNQYTAVTDMLKEFHVPIIMDADLGHLPPSMPLITGAMAKVEEELAEVKEAAAADDAKALEEELGDLLFTVVNLCRWKNLQAEEVIHGGIRKFVERFKNMESLIHVKGSTPEEMMEAWRKAKLNAEC